VRTDLRLLELAENANTYTPLAPGEERIERDGFVLWLGRGSHPSWSVAQRFRLREDEVEEVMREIHALVPAKGRSACTWEVGTHATPGDLVDRLLALGLVDFEEPLAIGMVLTDEPGAPPERITVRKVESLADLHTHVRITNEAFGMDEAHLAEQLAGAAKTWAEDDPARGARFLASIDGEPVAAALSTYTPWGVVLNAGSTLAAARGRGAYRALVHARWRDAVAHGTPALVTQAGRMSRPILERLGFRELCEIRILLYEFEARGT
jgi:hypothetical protein